jgi:hypothetical protein
MHGTTIVSGDEDGFVKVWDAVAGQCVGTFDGHPEPGDKSSQDKPSKVKPSQAKPSQAKPSQAKPNQAKPSQTKPDQAKSSHTPRDLVRFEKQPNRCKNRRRKLIPMHPAVVYSKEKKNICARACV